MKILLVTVDTHGPIGARYGGLSGRHGQARAGTDSYPALVTVSEPPSSYDWVVVETGDAVNNDDAAVTTTENEPAKPQPERLMATRDASVRQWRNEHGGMYELSVRQGPQGGNECVFEYHRPCQINEFSSE